MKSLSPLEIPINSGTKIGKEKGKKKNGKKFTKANIKTTYRYMLPMYMHRFPAYWGTAHLGTAYWGMAHWPPLTEARLIEPFLGY